DQIPLVNEKIVAGAKFLAEFDKRVPIRGAFWLRKEDGRRWYLYVVTDQADPADRRMAYEEVVAAAQVVRDPNLDMFQVRLIGRDEALAREVLHIVPPGSDPVPVRIFDRLMGEVSAAEVYIYPQPLPVVA
ncbi:MAG TPA: hypothetical protein PK867_26595, partial [Pirellulales bacterium]|nr:hypothetical protein [Pirellulales bacterium]